MLSPQVQKTLNHQIGLELYASHLYLGMGTWCYQAKLLNAAKFMYAHSEQEREHFKKLIHYMNHEKGNPTTCAVKEPPSDYKTVLDLFEHALENEQQVTKCVHDAVELCLKIKDYGTMKFLEWFVEEQQEEEQLFDHLIDMIKMIGINDKRGLYMVDKAIGKMMMAKASA